MDRYQRIRMLGSGAFARVILVRHNDGPPPHSSGSRASDHIEDSDLCVVKEVSLQVEPQRRSEALREADVLKSLTHSNIIACHDAFFADSRLCIVMEYADGGDLCAAIARRRAAGGQRFLEREAMAVFVQLAMALQYIHGRRILHRDLKSKNVFLTRAGVVKLGDFGIAKVFEGSDSYAETRIGTPYYLPPEMCNNLPYDFRADVWCLGVILYEILALEVPFSAPSVAALAVKICTTEPHPVSPSYSSESRALIGRMLAKNAEERPLSSEIVAMPHVRRSAAALFAMSRNASGKAVGPVHNGAKLGMDCAVGRGGGNNGSSGSCGNTGMDPNNVKASAKIETHKPLVAPCVVDANPNPRPFAEIDLDTLLGECFPSDEVAGDCAPALPSKAESVGLVQDALQDSLIKALESTFSCEELLHELERELNLH